MLSYTYTYLDRGPDSRARVGGGGTDSLSVGSDCGTFRPAILDFDRL